MDWGEPHLPPPTRRAHAHRSVHLDRQEPLLDTCPCCCRYMVLVMNLCAKHYCSPHNRTRILLVGFLDEECFQLLLFRHLPVPTGRSSLAEHIDASVSGQEMTAAAAQHMFLVGSDLGDRAVVSAHYSGIAISVKPNYKTARGYGTFIATQVDETSPNIHDVALVPGT